MITWTYTNILTRKYAFLTTLNATIVPHQSASIYNCKIASIWWQWQNISLIANITSAIVIKTLCTVSCGIRARLAIMKSLYVFNIIASDTFWASSLLDTNFTILNRTTLSNLSSCINLRTYKAITIFTFRDVGVSLDTPWCSQWVFDNPLCLTITYK